MPKRVLIVEDTPDILDLAIYMLSNKAEGLEVVGVKRSADIDWSQDFDVAVVDLMLTYEDPKDPHPAVRIRENWPDIHMILWTAAGPTSLDMRPPSEGVLNAVDVVLFKPVNAYDLVGEVEAGLS